MYILPGGQDAAGRSRNEQHDAGMRRWHARVVRLARRTMGAAATAHAVGGLPRRRWAGRATFSTLRRNRGRVQARGRRQGGSWEGAASASSQLHCALYLTPVASAYRPLRS
eukprot:scaffold201_cov405-Prasinococcus_capsulatus_cf.AAC.51